MLEVEVVAREASVAGLALVRDGARGYADLVDQFRRALVSVALNTSEGLGRHGGDRGHLLSVARGSAKEASVALALLVAMGLVPADPAGPVEAALDRVRAMLWRLAHRA